LVAGGLCKAIQYHTQCLAIAKEVGDRAGEGRANGNLSNAYDSQGHLAKAIEYHTQHLAIAKEMGDRVEKGKAYGNIGNAYQSLGDFSKAIEYHGQDLAIAKEVGDRAGEGIAYERECCLLVLNLVSSTLSCICRPRPQLLVLDVCGFV